MYCRSRVYDCIDYSSIFCTWFCFAHCNSRQRHAFEHRLLTNRINFSLNSVLQLRDGTVRLHLRTLKEVNVEDLMPNPHGVRVLVDAASSTVSSVSPLLYLPPKDHWTWYNQVVNEVTQISQ